MTEPVQTSGIVEGPTSKVQSGDGGRSATGPTIPRAEIQAARKELATQAKIVQQAAVELEQLALIEEVPFEEAMCLSTDEVKKRYTAENARQIEWRREACIKLLARQCPAEDICDILKMNHRTVAAIAAQEGQKIALHADKFADTLATSAMSDIALAETKKFGASHKDLHIAAGIKLTHYQSLKGMGAVLPPPDAMDVETVDEDLRQFREGLKKLKAASGPVEGTK